MPVASATSSAHQLRPNILKTPNIFISTGQTCAPHISTLSKEFTPNNLCEMHFWTDSQYTCQGTRNLLRNNAFSRSYTRPILYRGNFFRSFPHVDAQKLICLSVGKATGDRNVLIPCAFLNRTDFFLALLLLTADLLLASNKL